MTDEGPHASTLQPTQNPASTLTLQAARANMTDEGGPSTQDRSVRALLRDSGRVGVHPMMRHIAAVVGAGQRHI